MTDCHRPQASSNVLPYATPAPTGHQSIRPSAFLFAVTFYTLCVGMTYAGEASFGAPKGEYGAGADAMIIALLAAPFAILSMITFAVTARATAAKAAFPAIAAVEGTICGTIIAILVVAGNAMGERAITGIAVLIVAVLSPISSAMILGFLSRRALAKVRLK